MKKRVTVTKVTRLLKIADILQDILSAVSDEELIQKYELSWKQLGKVYSKLFYGGYLSKEELSSRIELRSGRDCSHIPLVDIQDFEHEYECQICGFSSPLHFSACPRCRQINLRRLTRRIQPVVISSGHAGQYAGN